MADALINAGADYAGLSEYTIEPRRVDLANPAAGQAHQPFNANLQQHRDEENILRVDHKISFVGLTILRLHYQMSLLANADELARQTWQSLTQEQLVLNGDVSDFLTQFAAPRFSPPTPQILPAYF